MGGLPAFSRIFKIHLSADHSSYIGQWRDLHICARRAQTIPAPIALKIYHEAHFINSFLNMQAELVFSS
jgi:hypothetical protein